MRMLSSHARVSGQHLRRGGMSPRDWTAIIQAGSMMEDLGNTSYHNLTRPQDAASRFQGRAVNESMRAADVRQIVFSSSATVYGNPATVPIREDFPLSATNPYGRSKLMAEEILTGELSLPDFGRFEVRWTKPMIGRNPLIPDVEIAIPPRPKVYFKPSKELADRVIKTLAVGASKK